MELRPGYKQTEVGVIPEEWEALSACAIGVFKGGSGFPLTAQGETNGEYPFFKVSDMNNEGNETFMTTANHYISEQTRKHLGATVFPADSIVFAKVGAAVFLERKKILGQPSCIDNNMAAFVLDRTRADVRYVHSLLLSKKLSALVATTALPALNGKQLGEMALAVPPRAEQRAIATALSDVDVLLGALDRLIAKKRDLKQATMQQLLTGQTRLPGFSGEWDLAGFGEIATIRNAKVVASTAPIGTCCVELDGLSQGTGRLLGTVEAAGASSKYIFKLGDVLFGRLRAYLRKFWLATFDGICSTEIWPLIPRNERLCGAFLHLLVQSEKFIEAAGMAYGTHMPRSDWSVLRNIQVGLPLPSEQTSIAAVISDIDAEIEALDARRTKTRDLKQAMMQELLTGRIRLAEPEMPVDPAAG